jgi:uncharacterized protein YdhG (YjbR/CyaY superfamily)/TfoX/Sxy family transcriptional regulator of competence genes
MARNREVDAWFATYENPMKKVVQRIREIVLAADPRIAECIKWQAPTFTYEGNLASFFPRSKQHASLMFHEGAKIPGKHPRLEGGGDTGRFLKIATVAEADAAKRDIVRIVKAWCDWKDEGASAKKSSAKKATAKKVVAKNAPREKAVATKAAQKESGVDEALAQRIRDLLRGRKDVVEKRMFGGLCFMVNGQMCCGVNKDTMVVRVGKEGYEDALSQPHARPMTFTGRALTGLVYVDPPGYKTAASLGKWVARGIACVSKPTKSKAKGG